MCKELRRLGGCSIVCQKLLSKHYRCVYLIHVTVVLTLKVLVATIDALGHFETG